MRILGLDPGLAISGYGVLDVRDRALHLVEAGVLRTDVRAPLEQRLAQLHADLSAVIVEVQPDAVAVEDLYSHYAHPKTAIVMGHARGVLMLAAAEAGLAVSHYPSTRVKKSLTGNGHASKEQVGRTIAQVLALDSVPQPADVTDALAIAMCHANAIARDHQFGGGAPIL